jgi:hypothetical protein
VSGPLSNAHAVTKLPAQDLERARADGVPSFASAGAPSGTSTQMGFEVPDLEATLTDLLARGVVFERYEMPGFEARGVIVAPDNYPSKGTGELGAFFYDSEDNLIAIAQPIRESAQAA